MGRRKTYDRDDVVMRAMKVFWRQGYEATTIGGLEEQLQINRYSLFAEFGSKQALFEAAIDAYASQVVTAYLGGMEAPGADVEAIVGFFDRFRQEPGPGAPTGCMICNAAVEQAPDSPMVRATTLRYFERLTEAFRNALPRDDGAAAALSTAVVGAFVQARAGVSAEVRAEVLDRLVGWVRSMAAPPRPGGDGSGG